MNNELTLDMLDAAINDYSTNISSNYSKLRSLNLQYGLCCYFTKNYNIQIKYSKYYKALQDKYDTSMSSYWFPTPRHYDINMDADDEADIMLTASLIENAMINRLQVLFELKKLIFKNKKS